jgi:uncharacterized protein
MLRERFDAALIDFLKNREKHKTATLRLIIAALKDADIAARSKGNYEGISNVEIVGLLQKMVKQRLQSIEMYEQAGRLELAQQEADEIEIIKSFLPEPLSEDEMRNEISTAIANVEASGLKDMKKVIEDLKSRCGERIDFSKASPVIRDMLCNIS